MYNFKDNEIIILLGAGASYDAELPHSAKMIKNVETLIKDDPTWQHLGPLYYYIRSAIYHSFGIRGKFDNDVNYNIETLVNTLNELIQKQEHTLYPFVGAWNPTLVELAGTNFDAIKSLKAKILNELRSIWLVLDDKNQAGYYKGLVDFKKEYNYPLRVFSLNYDTCVEDACEKVQQDGFILELGFDDDRKWNWRRFTDTNPDEVPDIFFYKLHGSTNWKYDDDRLTFTDAPNLIKDEEAAIIFGTSYKLQYRDPFLFLTYEFRKWALESRLIVCIGYGFGDDHINKIVQQALSQNEERMLLSIAPFEINPDSLEESRSRREVKVAEIIKHKNARQISCREYKGFEFMKKYFNLDFFAKLFPQKEEPFDILDN